MTKKDKDDTPHATKAEVAEAKAAQDAAGSPPDPPPPAEGATKPPLEARPGHFTPGNPPPNHVEHVEVIVTYNHGEKRYRMGPGVTLEITTDRDDETFVGTLELRASGEFYTDPLDGPNGPKLGPDTGYRRTADGSLRATPARDSIEEAQERERAEELARRSRP